MDRSEKWEGGFVLRDTRGRPVYWIRRSVAGRRYEVSTRCRTEAAAHRELVRFETDPEGYRPGGIQERIVLDDAMGADFLQAQADKGVTRKWLAAQRKYLAWWQGVLAGRDLRHLSLRRDILPALAGQGGRHLRIATLKRLFAWLREQDRIATADDPTLGKLPVPKTRAAQDTAPKLIPLADFESARSHMMGAYRDGLDVQAGTGWHITEMIRFGQGGVIEPYHGDDPDAAAVLVCPRHKSGGAHRTAVTADVASAARRLLAHGGISDSRYRRALHAACAAAGVPRFQPGWFRHTVATLATEAGQANAVPTFLGHRSAATTRKFYATRAVPPRVRTLR
jgi:integrase